MTRIPSQNRLQTRPGAPGPVASSVTPGPSTDPTPRADSYQRAGTSGPLPSAGGTPSGSVRPGALQSAQLAGGAEGVRLALEAIKNRLTVSVQALPDLAEAPLERALRISADRVWTAFQEGRISVTEAERTTENLSDMLDALVAVERGQCQATVVTQGLEPGTRAYDITTTSHDVVRVMVREDGGTAGQARLKMYNLADEGVELRNPERMMVRFDLEGSERTDAALQARLDVHFGLSPEPGVELLDKRIHGIMLGPDGQPLLNRGGRTIADHHFGQDIPEPLHDRERFRAFTREFLDKVLSPTTGGA
ncbi:MAG: hypothetical protein AB2A00_25670 [Myxococcota bacterium]